MKFEEIRNLEIDGVGVPFYDGYVTVQEGVVTGKLTRSGFRTKEIDFVDYRVGLIRKKRTGKISLISYY
ncbi:hypothetical protein [Bacillus wiedmannii]|uniref:hypothetical protein n=1 Tax=Bacillus wiedmannii TaxID=1890302 RepID=UPI001155E6E3|nr:hypothetical protein [Bacillus wiedmannii]